MSKFKNYWAGEGRLQSEYDKLYNELVPASGEADTVAGEMIRGVSRILYDYYNNGNINIQNVKSVSITCNNCGGSGEVEDGIDEDGEEIMDTCYECNGDGEIEEDDEITINEYYDKMFEVIETHCKDNAVSELQRKIIGIIFSGATNNEWLFSKENEDIYNEWSEKVIEYVLANEAQLKSEKYLP